jgi:hypothetical protein
MRVKKAWLYPRLVAALECLKHREKVRPLVQVGEGALAGVKELVLNRGVQLLRLVLRTTTLHLDG